MPSRECMQGEGERWCVFCIIVCILFVVCHSCLSYIILLCMNIIGAPSGEDEYVVAREEIEI